MPNVSIPYLSAYLYMRVGLAARGIGLEASICAAFAYPMSIAFLSPRAK